MVTQSTFGIGFLLLWGCLLGLQVIVALVGWGGLQWRSGQEPTPKEQCPFCLQPVDAKATKCPHCREWIDETIRLRTPGLLLLGFCTSALGILVHIRLAIVPQFLRLFQDFGATLPLFTIWGLHPAYTILSCLALLGLTGIALFVPERLRRRNLLLGLTASFGMLACLLQIWSFYLPIYALAKPIQ